MYLELLILKKYTLENCIIYGQQFNVIANKRMELGIKKEKFDMQCKNDSSKTDFEFPQNVHSAATLKILYQWTSRITDN